MKSRRRYRFTVGDPRQDSGRAAIPRSLETTRPPKTHISNSTQRRPDLPSTTPDITDTRGANRDSTNNAWCPRQDSNLRRPA